MFCRVEIIVASSLNSPLFVMYVPRNLASPLALLKSSKRASLDRAQHIPIKPCPLRRKACVLFPCTLMGRKEIAFGYWGSLPLQTLLLTVFLLPEKMKEGSEKAGSHVIGPTLFANLVVALNQTKEGGEK